MISMRRHDEISTRPSILRFVRIFALLVLAGSVPAAAQEKVKPKDLAPQFQEWLKVTTYIIKDKERDVFLHLTNDRDRNLFIDAFWNVRDPTPGTPQNEFKDEHMKRFLEANKKFRYGSPREGWMTDRGRIYIILGPPSSQSYFAGSNDHYPAELWSYYGDTAKGMPTHFELMFFQWRNAGEMKLYDPVSDGPGRLLVDTAETDSLSPSDYEGMYDRLFQSQPDLARASLSIIPGEIPIGFQPSMETPIYMAAIMDSPKKGLNESYATHFLNYKGLVSTEYLTNYMANVAEVAILHDPLSGMAFCHFAMAPERLSLDYYEPRSEYYCNFQVDVNLREDDTIIFQYSKEFPLAIPDSQLSDTESMGVVLADSFPVIEGKYKLTVLLRNTVGREFSILERDIEVPPTSAGPRIGGPIFGTKMTGVEAGMHQAFQTGGRKINVDPKNTFAASDRIAYLYSIAGVTRELWERGIVEVTVKGSNPDAAFVKSFTLPLNLQPYRQVLSFAQEILGGEIPPDYYDVALVLKGPQGNTLDERTGHFIVSPVQTLSHPIIASRTFSLANSFIFQYMLAYQYDKVGQADRAESAYRTAYDLNPGYHGKIPEYAAFLLSRGKAEEALILAEAISGDTDLNFEYFLLKGRAFFALKRYNEAILSLQEGNKIYNSDAGLLAALGAAYYRTGQNESALAVLKASLNLNPEQKEVKALIEEIEKKK